MHARRLLAVGFMAAPIVAAEGCSLVFPYADLKDAPVDASDETSLAEAGGSDASNGPIDAGSEAAAETGASDGGGAESGPLPPQGVLVVAGIGNVDGGNAYVLSVLDAATGAELSREVLPVVGLSYDGATGNWYIFETLNPGTGTSTGGPFTAPGDPVVLHVRQLDTHTGKWTELNQSHVPQVPAVASLSPDYIAPLTNRLAYIAWNPGTDARSPGYELVTLDVSSPENPGSPIANPPPPTATVTPLLQGVVTMMGTRASGVNGGIVSLIQSDSLTAPMTGPDGAAIAAPCTTLSGRCQFQVEEVHLTENPGSMSDTATFGAPVAIGSPYSSASPLAAGGGSFLNMGAPNNVIAFPSIAEDDGSVVTNEAGIPQPGPGTLQQFTPSTNMATSDPTVVFSADAFRFDPLVFDECLRTAIVGESNGSTIFAVPMSAGASSPAALGIGHPSAAVAFDPYTSTAFVSFNSSASKVIAPYTVGGTAMAPTLTPATVTAQSGFKPPNDLEANAIATEQPIPAVCSSGP